MNSFKHAFQLPRTTFTLYSLFGSRPCANVVSKTGAGIHISASAERPQQQRNNSNNSQQPFYQQPTTFLFRRKLFLQHKLKDGPLLPKYLTRLIYSFTFFMASFCYLPVSMTILIYLSSNFLPFSAIFFNPLTSSTLSLYSTLIEIHCKETYRLISLVYEFPSLASYQCVWSAL